MFKKSLMMAVIACFTLLMGCTNASDTGSNDLDSIEAQLKSSDKSAAKISTAANPKQLKATGKVAKAKVAKQHKKKTLKKLKKWKKSRSRKRL